MLFATKFRTPAAAAAAARVLKTRGMPQSLQRVSCSTSVGPHPRAAVAGVAGHTKPAPSCEYGWRLSLALAAVAAVATAAATTSFAGDDDNSNNRAARNSAATASAVGSDKSSLSVEETRAFVAALGEAVGKEHVSTDEGE